MTDFDLTGALPFDSDADAVTPQKPSAAVLAASQFAYVGQGLTVAEFQNYVSHYDFGTIPPDYVVLHHTAIPSTLAARYPSGAVWDDHEAGLSVQQIEGKRRRQLDALMAYYKNHHGWDRGPHLFIDERWIWLFTPMNTVGIHAAQGNSYRSPDRKLHYSIGIEMLGYYEKTVWPAAVARNVGMAVAILKRRLKTFDYIDKPWAGGVSAHRHYNKPECPGARITPAYYMPILKGAWEASDPPPSPTKPLSVYRVRVQDSRGRPVGGATIRAGAGKSFKAVGGLKPGQEWRGDPIAGDATLGGWVDLEGFAPGNIWVQAPDGRSVWMGLLERVKGKQ